MLQRWTWKHWCALGAVIIVCIILISNVVRNLDSAETRSQAGTADSSQTAAVEDDTDPVPTNTEPPVASSSSPPVEEDDEEELSPDQYGGEPDYGPSGGKGQDLPRGEKWFDDWKPVSDQLGAAFVDTAVGQKDWAESVTEFMTDHLADSYESVDIRNVPQGTFKESVLLADSSTPKAIWAEIRYDSFTMNVKFVYEEDSWKADQIEPKG